MLTTLLELAGMALLVAAAGFTFGVGAALGSAGVAFIVLGVALERPTSRSTTDDDASRG